MSRVPPDAPAEDAKDPRSSPEPNRPLSVAERINLIVVATLGLAAGVPKLLSTAPEVALFQRLGVEKELLLLFGAMQVLGGFLLLAQRTRFLGARITASFFLASAVMLLVDGQIAFGVVSFVPIVLAAAVANSARA